MTIFIIQQMQVTSAMVHPRCDGHGCHGDGLDDPEATDASNIERHPEENLSIVETPEHRDERLGLVGSQPGRRKLYFNPAYFEHELLLVRIQISIASEHLSFERCSSCIIFET